MTTAPFNDVQAMPLKEVACFIRGITFKPDDLVEPGTEGSVVCMRTKNVQTDLDQTDLIAVPSEFVKRDEQFLHETDIIVSTANSWELVGKCSWIPKLDYSAAAGGFISILRANPERVNPRYLYYWFSSAPTQHEVRNCGRQTTNISNMSYERCLALKVPLPPLSEQKRIADILDKADAIRRKRQEARYATESFLVSQFLETFGHPATNPMGWPTIAFGEVVENHDSQRVPLKQSDRDKREGPFPYYGSVGIIDHIDDYLFEGEFLLISEDGKHLDSRNRPIACLASGKFWVNNHAHVLASNGTVDLGYLARYMEMSPIRSFVTGIDQYKLNRSSLNRIPIAIPPIHLQTQFREQQAHVGNMLTRQLAAQSDANDLFTSLIQRAFRANL